MKIRYSHERGHANHGWLDSYHSFSFANFYDPDWMGFYNLRVINEDRIESGRGFGDHPHENMEIISYVLEGELAHKDSMGNIQTIKKGEIQRISAGKGVIHSEFNPSKTEQTHFLQIWLLPNKTNVTPEYSQKNYSQADKRGRLVPVIKPYNSEQTLSEENLKIINIHADATLWLGYFTGNNCWTHSLEKGRPYYLHVATGEIKINNILLKAGDSALFEAGFEGMVEGGEKEIIFSEGVEAEVLLFKLK